MFSNAGNCSPDWNKRGTCFLKEAHQLGGFRKQLSNPRQEDRCPAASAIPHSKKRAVCKLLFLQKEVTVSPGTEAACRAVCLPGAYKPMSSYHLTRSISQHDNHNTKDFAFIKGNKKRPCSVCVKRQKASAQSCQYWALDCLMGHEPGWGAHKITLLRKRCSHCGSDDPALLTLYNMHAS